MKYLNTYKKLGLNNNPEEVFDYFITTLKESIFTWEYFVDWEKIDKNISKIEKELNILNYLIGKNNIEKEFIKLLNEYPHTIRILPLLLAIRDSKAKNSKVLSDLDELNYDEFNEIFYSNKIFNFNDKKLLNFFNNSGLKEIFMDKKIKNLVDYCYGVEVGLDTNARKNRTGILMEKIVEKYLSTFMQKFDYSYIKQATPLKIQQKWKYSIEVDKYSRVFDFAIFNGNNHKLFLIEVNYYSGGGSKLKSTAGEFKDIHSLLKKQGISFVWVTDGLGWKTSKNPLFETFNNNDYVFNLELLYSGILEEIML